MAPFENHRIPVQVKQDTGATCEHPATLLPGVLAVIGCDGSGKSSLTSDLLQRLREHGQTEWRYLGLVSGEMGDRIKEVPLIGIRLERYLAAKAARAQNMRKKLPGVFTAIVMYGMSVWRRRKLRRVLELSRRGVLVVTDRYPQAEIPGFHYDGPGLQGAITDNRFVHWLARREAKTYGWMSSQIPSLVLRLNVDIETALKRKPDHDATELADKIAVMPKLRFNGARIVDIDTRAPYPEVLEAAWRAVETNLLEKNGARPRGTLCPQS